MKRSEEKRIRFMSRLARNKGRTQEELLEHFGKEFDETHRDDEKPPTAAQRETYLKTVNAILSDTFAQPGLTPQQLAAEAAARESRVYDVPPGTPFDPTFDPEGGRG